MTAAQGSRPNDVRRLTVVQAWVMTEVAPVETACRLSGEIDAAEPDEHYGYRSRHGIAVPLVEVRRRGDDGALIAWDDEQVGELEVCGPWVASCRDCSPRRGLRRAPAGSRRTRRRRRRRAEDLRARLAGELAKWQLPQRFEFVQTISRTATGKFKKTELREQFAGTTI